jgi:three-Cys-motif partner protein
MSKTIHFDEIGYWSKVKLDIVKEYAAAYSKILAAQKNPSLYHIYIDAFAGAGMHISKKTKEFVQGSPLNALLIEPQFKEYHLIDLDSKKIAALRAMTGESRNVTVYKGNCNELLVEKVFPRAKYSDYRRALCLLDPYGLHLKWEIMYTAGQMKSIEIFLNFPVMDMNMNVLWNDPEKVDPQQSARMTAFWGDETWRQAAYNTRGNLFGWAEKTDNDVMAEAFRQRLIKAAGFQYVPEPIPMRNSNGATVYYLFFASQKPAAEHIIKDIFNKYRNKGIK